MATFTVNQRTTARITASLVDETGAAVSGASLTSATLSLIDVATGTVLNSRTAQNVLNLNGVTIDTAGNLVWTMDPADNAMVGSKATETHAAIFVMKWGGTKELTHRIDILVMAIPTVT